MNTIQIVNEEGQTVNYTSAEINNIIQNGKAYAADATRGFTTLREVRNQVRDFFSEGEWSSGEQTIEKSDVNRLLEDIGCRKLTSKYTGTGTVEFTFEVEAEDEDEARSLLDDNISLNYSCVDITDEQLNIDNVNEYE